MKVKQIFLDLDDVLNNFTMEALTCVISDTDFTYDPEWGFDIVRAANALLAKRDCYLFTPMTPEFFWSRIKRHFWANVIKSDECDWLIEACVQIVGKENVCILTTPTEDPGCLAGKLEWIKDKLPRWMHRQYMMSPRKDFCAKPEALLIDDSDKNVNEFRAAGGRAILVPRPWNSNHMDSCVSLMTISAELRGAAH